MDGPPERVVAEAGKGLAQPRLSKDSLVKLLKQAESALSKMKQSSSLKTAIEPLNKSLVQKSLLHHKDKGVKLLVTACLSEIIRILAPDPPFSDNVFKDVFRLIVDTFMDLADTASPYFARRLKILEDVAALKCCVLMLDLDHEDLVVEMFKVFFSVVKEGHQQTVFQYMLSIMAVILEEKVLEPIVNIILRNLMKEEKGAAYRLAVSVIQNSAGKLEPSIRSFFTSCIMDRDAFQNEVKGFYHKIILEIYKCAPQILITVIPNLIQELLIDQVDVRLEAVRLIGRLLALSKLHFCQEYHAVYVEFLKRFSDKSAEVRIAAIECAKACYMANTSGNEAHEILTALQGRLLDFDDKVRTHAVIAVCYLARSNLSCFPSQLILQAMERLRDKKVSVRKTAMQKLLGLYRMYCDKCSEGLLMLNNHYEQIPSRILVLCFDKDSIEFRSQNMELVLAEDLFPDSLSVRDRIKHWISFFSLFTMPQIKAFNSILSQKRRLQMEMRVYLTHREKEKENDLEEVHKRALTSFLKMSASFADSSKANECLQKLHQMKVNNIFKTLLELVNESTTYTAVQSSKITFLKRIGKKHPNYDFFKMLSSKCSYSIFTAEHVHNILEDIQSQNSHEDKYVRAAIDLLLIVVGMFPSLLRGSEEQLLRFFSEETTFLREKILQILARAGRHVSIKLSHIYPFLEQICIEGTRSESKNALSVIESLTDASDNITFSSLCKKLVSALWSRCNIPTILQSLGCLSQHSLSNFELYEEQITQFIYKELFCSMQVHSLNDQTSIDGDSICSSSCKLKIYGLKTIVKSFLPKQVAHVRHRIKEFFSILMNIIQENGIMYGISSSESDKAHLRLAAAKSILRLATRWDSHISPEMFQLTIMMARDPSSTVRRPFLCKIHKLLMEHAIPSRYSCAFVLASSDSLGDIRIDSMKHFIDFLKEYGRGNIQQSSSINNKDGGSITNFPEYIVVFLIHALAHDRGFPSENSQDEDVYAEFCSPLIVFLQASVKNNIASNSQSHMFGLFRAIKKAQDAVDSRKTPKLHILSTIGIHVLKALAPHCKSSDSPNLILLPSSFYKVSHQNGSQEAYCHNHDFIDESFVKRILNIVDSHIARPASSDSTQCRNSLENAKCLEPTKNKSSNLLLGWQADLVPIEYEGEKVNPPYGKDLHETVPHKVISKAKQMKILSAASSRSTELRCEKLALYNNRTSLAPEIGAPSFRRVQHSKIGEEKLSSCDSASTKPSFSDSQVLSEETEQKGCISLMANYGAITSSRYATEPIENFRSSSESFLCEKELGDKGEILVGHRIRIWSPLDKCFSSGTVDSYDSQNSACKITHDNGDVELVCLENEKWEVIEERPTVNKDKCNFQPKDWKVHDTVLSDITRHKRLQESKSSRFWAISSSGSLEDDTDSRDGSEEQTVTLDKEVSKFNDKILSTGTHGGKNKRYLQKTAGKESLESNVTDISRRTRARRV